MAKYKAQSALSEKKYTDVFFSDFLLFFAMDGKYKAQSNLRLSFLTSIFNQSLFSDRLPIYKHRRQLGMDNLELVQKALDARKNSYSPYSKYKVGAALLCQDGTVYTGANIENASYPCGICAERTAMAKAVSEGRHSFKSIAIAGSSNEICTPCGMCRQFMYEFAPELKVLCSDNKGNYKEHKLSDLLTEGFGAAVME